MSSPQLALLPPRRATAAEIIARPVAWWRRFASPCDNPACPHRDKLWPSRLRANSSVLFDSRRFCEPACFYNLLEYRVRSLLASFLVQKSKVHRLPIGLLLLEQGAINKLQLREAVRLQRESTSVRLGDFFLRSGTITEQQLTSVLAQQWGCPVFPLDGHYPDPSWGTLLPPTVLESAFAVPAHASADAHTLHIAFAERPDHTLLYAVEQMLDCQTVACMAPQSAVVNALCHPRAVDRTEVCFDTVRDPREIAATICNYTQELRASRIVVARVTAHIWVRFFRQDAIRDLLFRVLPDQRSALTHLPAYPIPKPFSLLADNRKDGVSNATLRL
jgi:hypothetical protein